MEPFKIRCMTCQAGLSVRDESLLGQIVSCPRCGSMVEVLPPEPVAESPGEVAAALPAREVVSTPVAAAGNFKFIAGVLACVLVGVAALGFVLLSDEGPTASANSIGEQATNQPAPPASTQSVVEVEPEQKATQVPTEVIPVVVPKATTDLQPPVEAPPAPAAVAEPEAAPQPTDTQPTNTQPINTEPEPPALVRKFNPLEYDPENLDLTTLDQEVTPQTITDQPAPAANNSAPPKSPAAPPARNVVRRSPATDTTQHGLPVLERLRLEIPALKFQSLALGDFLHMVSQLSGVPVSAAPEQLLMSGITLRQPVSLAATDISLEVALVRVLSPLNLEYAVQDHQIVVLRREAAKVREINYPIADLVSTACPAELLADWCRQLVAPETWHTAGGKGVLEIQPGTLRVTQPQQVHYQLLIFLDRLRLARNLQPKSRFPVKRLAGESPWLVLKDRLSAPTTFTFSQYTTLDEIFAHWEQEIGVPILVDWPALARQQLWPQSRIACAIAGEPWRQALDSVLAPLGLSWRAIPGKMLEITSTEKVETELQLDMFFVQDSFSKEQPAREESQAFVVDPVSQVLMTLLPASAQRQLVQQHAERKVP